MSRPQKTGVLVVNLGTPLSYRVADVRRYLKEFLSDPRVIDIPAVLRFLLLNLIILPFRSPKSAAAYQTIWTPQGSPLSVYTQNLADNMQAQLGSSYVVRVGMRYQSPSITKALAFFQSQNIDNLIVLPLFPQYSSAATGSALECVYTTVSRLWNVLPLQVLPSFFDHPGFIRCFAHNIRTSLVSFPADHVLFSYHGLPERHILKSACSTDSSCVSQCLSTPNCCAEMREDNTFCYRAQCFATTQALVKELVLPIPYSTSFQSRLGRSRWIEPYTDVQLSELANRGIQNLMVVCPAFTADCLETLEEINIRAAEQWRSLGGKDLVLVPSLNASEPWTLALSSYVQAVTRHNWIS